MKLLIVSQFILIVAKKHTSNSKIYVLTDTVFKLSLAIYIWVFIWTNSYEGLEWEEKTIFSFSAAIIIYDINYTAILKEIESVIPDNILFRHIRKIESTKPHRSKDHNMN